MHKIVKPDGYSQEINVQFNGLRPIKNGRKLTFRIKIYDPLNVGRYGEKKRKIHIKT